MAMKLHLKQITWKSPWLAPLKQSAGSPPSTNDPFLDSNISPLEKAIREDRPARPWSKNVPKRRCSKDEECGDGFCDRGGCAAIWTSSALHGQQCSGPERCVDYLCIDGRCRSCISDAECADEPDNQNPRCISEPFVPGSRACVGVAPSIKGSGAPNPPLPPIKP